MAEDDKDFLTIDPNRTSIDFALAPGQWLEYYCPGCRRRLHTKYGLFYHAAPEGDADYVEHAPLCGGRSHFAPGPLLANVCGP